MEHRSKQSWPAAIGSCRVILITRIDERHVATDAGGVPFGLAICDAGDGAVFLFRCEEGWEPVYDTWHLTVDEAMQQAADEIEGVSVTWKRRSR